MVSLHERLTPCVVKIFPPLKFQHGHRFADNKFNTGCNGNWQPEQAAPKEQRSSNWEDGLGHGDKEKNRKETKRLENRRDANERYHAKIAKDSMEKQRKEQARQDFHRLVEASSAADRKKRASFAIHERLCSTALG